MGTKQKWISVIITLNALADVASEENAITFLNVTPNARQMQIALGKQSKAHESIIREHKWQIKSTLVAVAPIYAQRQ